VAAAPDPASSGLVAEWASFGLTALTLVAGLVVRVLRQISRFEKRMGAIEELASDAYHEAAEVRLLLEDRQRRGGHRWYDSGDWRRGEPPHH
jgi:hypothetical protein